MLLLIMFFCMQMLQNCFFFLNPILEIVFQRNYINVLVRILHICSFSINFLYKKMNEKCKDCATTYFVDIFLYIVIHFTSPHLLLFILHNINTRNITGQKGVSCYILTLFSMLQVKFTYMYLQMMILSRNNLDNLIQASFP